MSSFKRNNGDVSKMVEWFSTIIPQRTQSVTICAWTTVPLWESRNPAERFLHCRRKENLRTHTLETVDEYLPYAYVTPSQGGIVQCQERPSGPVLSPREK